MAVENKYVDSDLSVGKLGNPAFISGAEAQSQIFNFEVAAADDDGSIYRIARSVNPNLIVKSITIYNDAITAGTDYDVGLYRPLHDGIAGEVKDADAFAATLDMSSAASKAPPKDGTSAIAIENIQQKIYELAGDTVQNKEAGYDIAITANTVGSLAGTISGIIEYVHG